MHAVNVETQVQFLFLSGIFDIIIFSATFSMPTDYIFLAVDFCRLCVVIRFFIPATKANDLRLRRIFLSQILSITFIFLS